MMADSAGVKGGGKLGHQGGVKLAQREYFEQRCVEGRDGVWSGGLRCLKGSAFRPERKTSSLALEVG